MVVAGAAAGAQATGNDLDDAHRFWRREDEDGSPQLAAKAGVPLFRFTVDIAACFRFALAVRFRLIVDAFDLPRRISAPDITD